MDSNSVNEFENRYEAKRAEGLVDLKFCTSSSATNPSPEVFCAEANAIDDAVARGDFEVFTFDDETK
ncbi:MAG: hypothetical protein KAT04_03905 [Methylococcales bacterium]|nr:hypothetical protein [Methylococcales bacterium]